MKIPALRFLPLLAGFTCATATLPAATLPSPVMTETTSGGKSAAVDPAGNLIMISSIGVQSIAPTGAVLWNTALEPYLDVANVTVDGAGFAYATGYRWEVNNVVSPWDVAVSKVAPNGELLWTSGTGLTGANDAAQKVVVDDQGGVYAAGWSRGTSDDLFLVKFDSNGVFQWSRRFNGSADLEDKATGLVAMPGGGVVVTGITRNPDEQFLTIRYSATGSPQWVAYYNAAGQTEGAPCGMVLTSDGGVAVAGMSGLQTVATVKYSAAGVELWANRTDLVTTSTTAEGSAHSIVAGPNGGAAVLGSVRSGTGGLTNVIVFSTRNDGATAWNTIVRATAYFGYPGMTALPGGGYVVASGYNLYNHDLLMDYARLTAVDAAGGGVTDGLIWPEPSPIGGDTYCLSLATGGDGSVWAAARNGVAGTIVKRFGSAPPPGAPIVSSFGADNLQPASVRLKALINPNGLTTGYYFEYGLTTSYGSTTPVREGSGR